MFKFLLKFLKLHNNSSFQQDLFDPLTDSIVLFIFNKVRDAKSLCLSMSVCKRFDSIIRQVDNVSLSQGGSKQAEEDNPFPKLYFGNQLVTLFPSRWEAFKYHVGHVLGKASKFFLQLPKSKKVASLNSDFNAPQCLKTFRNIQSLRIKLPSGRASAAGVFWSWDYNPDFGKLSQNSTSSNLLRWKAEFGSQLEKCVILFVTELSAINESHRNLFNHDNGNPDSDSYGEGEGEGEGDGEGDGKGWRDSSTRINSYDLYRSSMGTTSCLIEASIWHYMVQQILTDHQTLNNLVVAHESRAGKLAMNSKQIEEFKKSKDTLDVVMLGKKRNQLPATRMKTWYAPELRLPASGRVMKGATLVVIKPTEEGKESVEEEESKDWVVEAFENGVEEEEKVFGEAVRKLLEKKFIYQEDQGSF